MRKFVSVIKTGFLAFLTKIWDPQNFTFALENGQNSEARKSLKKKNVAWDFANSCYVKEKFQTEKKIKLKLTPKKTYIDRDKIGGGTYR